MARRTAVEEPANDGSPTPQGEQGASAQPQVAAGVGTQPAEQGQSPVPEKPVDLTEFEEFRRYQSAQQKQFDQLRKQLEQEQAERQRLAAQVQEETLNRLPEGQRAEYLMQQQQQQLQQMQGELVRYREQEARDQALRTIATETGVPYAAIADAPDPLTAAISLIKSWQAQGQQQHANAAPPAPTTPQPDPGYPQRQQSAPHTPFIGPGTAQHRTELSAADRAAELLRTHGFRPNSDPSVAHEYVKLLREANQGK